jgi:hypothetical protein
MSLASVRVRAIIGCVPLVLAGCGGAVQRAIIGPVIEISVAPTPSSRPASTLGSSSPNTTTPSFLDGNLRRWVVRADGARIDIRSGDAFGTYSSRIMRSRGFLFLPRQAGAGGARRSETAHLDATFEMTSLEAESRVVTAVLQFEFLEVDAFPLAHLDAAVRWTNPDSDDCHVEGTLELHGRKRRVKFDGALHVDADSARFVSTFDLDRRPFEIRRHDSWDFLVQNDFRVTLDLRATAERVTAEESDEHE